MSSFRRNDRDSDQEGRTSTSVDGGTVPLSEPSASRGPSRLGTRKEKANILSEPMSNLSSTPLTAHDAIVKDMDERLEAVRLAGGMSKSDSQASSEAGSPDPSSGLRTRPMEAILDAFSGQSLGLMAPQACDSDQNDIWSHLKQIKELQCEIATMHAQMEGLGGNERKPRRRETTGDDEVINLEEEAKAAKAAEFSKLADKFTGRKDAIDAVMGRLDVLSKTINDFHSTRTPALHFDSPSQDQTPFGQSMSRAASTPQKQKVLTDANTIHDSPESGARSL